MWSHSQAHFSTMPGKCVPLEVAISRECCYVHVQTHKGACVSCIRECIWFWFENRTTNTAALSFCTSWFAVQHFSTSAANCSQHLKCQGDQSSLQYAKCFFNSSKISRGTFGLFGTNNDLKLWVRHKRVRMYTIQMHAQALSSQAHLWFPKRIAQANEHKYIIAQ